METDFDFGSSYRVLQPIGRGASGVVYQAQHKGNNKQFAIKFLRDEYLADTEVVQRFITERSSLLSLNSSRIVRTYDLIADGGRLGIVMEYAPGPSLRTYLAEQGPLRPVFALTITRQILEALEVTHAQSVIHRDIKPDNIILTNAEKQADPGVKVTDFGVAKILGHTPRTTHIVGTPDYMAPELIQTATVAPSIDVYAVGITLYEMLSGRTPFGGSDTNPFTIAHHQVNTAVPPIEGLDERLAALLKQLLVKDPARRLDVASAIEKVAECIPLLKEAEALDAGSASAELHPATILKPGIAAAEESDGEDTEVKTKTTKGKLKLPNLKKAKTTLEEPAKLVPPTATELAGLPALSPVSHDTVLKELPTASTDFEEEENPGAAEKTTLWEKIKARRWLALSVAVLLVVGTGLGVWLWPKSSKPSAPRGPAMAIEASLEETALPSGLTVSRHVTRQPQSDALLYTVTYKPVKTPISGEVFEAVVSKDGQCLDVQWPADFKVKAHSPTVTSISAKCGWSVTLPKTTLIQPSVVKAEVRMGSDAPNTTEDLRAWLSAQSEATKTAISDRETVSTAYPLQRLSSLRIVLPGRVPQGDPVPVSINGVWPAGENSVTPVYTSPNAGAPTSILSDLTAGDSTLVRFTDRCSGAVAITADGHDVAALHPASCAIGATVGNFDVSEATITITGTGS